MSKKIPGARSLQRLVSHAEQVAEMRRVAKRLVRLGVALEYTAGFDAQLVAVAKSINGYGGILHAYSHEFEAKANEVAERRPSGK